VEDIKMATAKNSRVLRPITLIITICLLGFPAYAKYGGTGESDDPYLIYAAEMQTASTFLDAGWDFLDETANGTEDIWWILEGQDYPRLWWETE